MQETAISATSAARVSSRWVGLGLALLLASSFVLRLWFASAKLDASRFYDERFSFRNVSALVAEGRLKPNNAYYPSLSFLPQTLVLAATEGLYRMTGWQRLTIFDERKPFGFSATAYFLARLVSVIYGTLSIWLVFLLGRRLFSPAAGLLGAALLAAMWAHVLASAMFKPDILVLLLTLVAFGWSLDAAERPAAGSFLWAGVGVGLVAAAKYNGAGVAVAVGAAALWKGWNERRRWTWLILAGCAAMATFVALNPHLGLVFEYLGRQQILYEGKAVALGESHWGMPREQIVFLLRYHGLAVFVCALAGFLNLAAGIFRAGTAEPKRMQAFLVLSFVLGYSAFYAVVTPLFRPQNYLPVVAFTALLAAWTMVSAWRWIAGRGIASRWAPRSRRWAAVLLGVVVVASASRFSVAAAYRDVVPSTADLAGQFLQRRLQPVYLRQIVFERGNPVQPFRKGDRMPAVAVDRLPDAGERQLDLADGEAFPAARLDGPGGGFYLRRLAAADETQRLAPAFFAAHGPELVVSTHGWLLRDAQPLAFASAGEGRFETELPASLRPGEVFSVSLWLAAERGRPIAFELRLGSRPLAAFETRVDFRRARYLTPRMEFVPGVSRLSIHYRRELQSPPPRAELCRWRRRADRDRASE